MSSGTDVAVVGGGLIGLAVAWRAATAGRAVTVVDPAPGTGASWVAAGMLAPVTEVHYGEEALLRLNLAAARRYPAFVAELEQLTGQSVGYRTSGTLAVGLDAGDRAVLADLHAFQSSLGLEVELLRGRDCRALEPGLSPSVRAGLFVAGDHQVDNRRLARALVAAVDRCGGVLRRARVVALRTAADRVRGLQLDDGTDLEAAAVVLAAGCWSAGLAGVPAELVPPVRPVKGQILRLRAPLDPPFLGRNVRGLVAGGSVYVVPREDGEVVVGATVEELGFDSTVRAGAVHQLLRDARELLPGIDELELTETTVGLRPGTPDNGPLVGPTALPGLLLATGHYRNGVLLTPVTADAVAAQLSGAEPPAELAPFRPDRFTAGPAPTTPAPAGQPARPTPAGARR